jgi:carbamoyltransferase
MRTLGFSVGHDKGAAIIEDGKLLVAITEERITRIKNDGAYSGGKIPLDSMRYCLDYLGITFKDIDLFVYSTTEMKDDVESQLKSFFQNSKLPEIIFIPHHLSHAYSSFFSSNFDDAVVIVADASGSILTHTNKMMDWYPDVSRVGLAIDQDWTEGISIYHFTKENYKEVYKKWIKYPVPIDTNDDVSLGTIYSEGSLQLVFEPNHNTWPAGKLMGLASYANQDLVNETPFFVEKKENDIFIPNNRIFPRVTWKSDFYSRACVAGIYQREQERASLILAEIGKDLTNSKNVCVAGGSFLNCNSNEQILKSGLYENCYFIPPSDDSGIPLGCAWYGYQKLMNISEVEVLKPYTGKKYTEQEIVSAINKYPNLDYIKFDDFDELLEIVSYWLTQNRVIGWFQGSSELGPRALGNRSILASPIQKWMTGHINSDIKKREWYRPFAPAVMFEHQSEIFESDVFSPYMLVTTSVKEEWRNKIPAVVHIDNSARHQSVTKESNEKFYRLIESFYKKTDVPVLLNTSFNGPHEPIVESPEDAIKTFMSQNLDLLVIENYLFKNNII